jgi:hypothetical protein
MWQLQKVNHKNWSPTTKLYYGKYHTAFKIGPFPYHSPAYIPKHLSGFRIVNHYNAAYKITNTIYTDNQEVIDYILTDSYLRMHIQSVIGVVNQDHYDYLRDKDRHIILRDKIWYGKYKHKMSVWKTYKHINTTTDDAERALEFIHETFSDKESRMNGYFGAQFVNVTPYSQANSWITMPTVFTNNEAGIFLFKMGFNEKFTIKTESIVCLKDVIKV